MQKQFRKTKRVKKPNYKNKTFNKRPNHLKVVTVGLIHANWCGHCQALKPHWQKMKNEIKTRNKNENFHFVEIEDSDNMKEQKINNINKNLKEGKITVDGFPTIFKIKRKKIEYYGGEREAESLKNWFMKDDNKKNQQEEDQKQGLMQKIFGGGCGCNSDKLL
jgi:thiol-disulfide isomerase/thioredoxin